MNYECEAYLTQPLSPMQRKITFAYCTSNHRLFIKIGWWQTIPISKETYCAKEKSLTGVDNHADFMLQFFHYNTTRERCPS